MALFSSSQKVQKLAKSKKKRSKKQENQSKQPGRISRPLIAVGIATILAITTVFAFDLENGELKLAFNDNKAVSIIDLPENTPRLAVDQEEIDFGVLKHNTRKTFSFTVSNIGNDVLEFERTPYIKVDKGC